MFRLKLHINNLYCTDLIKVLTVHLIIIDISSRIKKQVKSLPNIDEHHKCYMLTSIIHIISTVLYHYIIIYLRSTVFMPPVCRARRLWLL